MKRSEAIEIVREYYPSSGKDLNEALETLVPELKESDDVFVSIDRGGYKDYDTGEIVDANITFWKHGTFTGFNE